MSHLTKYTLEFPINSSVNILYNRLSSASGLSEWFADDVIIKDKIFTFFWDGSDQKAILLKLKTNSFTLKHDYHFGGYAKKNND